jgi:hypothetical protein
VEPGLEILTVVQLRIPHPAKPPLKSESRVKTFADVRGLKYISELQASSFHSWVWSLVTFGALLSVLDRRALSRACA